jgi:hypothetical protein
VDHYQQIAGAAFALLPAGFDETLIWAEFDDGLINSSVFCRELDGAVRHYQFSPLLRQAISDHWRSWQETRPEWRTIAYRMKNRTYSVDLEFAEKPFGPAEWRERRYLVADICCGSIADTGPINAGVDAKDHHFYETSLVSTGCSKRGEWSFGR